MAVRRRGLDPRSVAASAGRPNRCDVEVTKRGGIELEPHDGAAAAE